LFAAGQAGERFAVRNSGAEVVVEGCGANGCEYMTGGMAVILGPVGENFAAGMTGGMAFIYDTDGTFEQHVNREHVTIQRVQSAYWDEACRRLVEEHVAETGSAFAEDLLIHWDLEIGNFWQVVPSEVIPMLEQPLVEGDGQTEIAVGD